MPSRVNLGLAAAASRRRLRLRLRRLLLGRRLLVPGLRRPGPRPPPASGHTFGLRRRCRLGLRCRLGRLRRILCLPPPLRFGLLRLRPPSSPPWPPRRLFFAAASWAFGAATAAGTSGLKLEGRLEAGEGDDADKERRRREQREDGDVGGDLLVDRDRERDARNRNLLLDLLLAVGILLRARARERDGIKGRGEEPRSATLAAECCCLARARAHRAAGRDRKRIVERVLATLLLLDRPVIVLESELHRRRGRTDGAHRRRELRSRLDREGVDAGRDDEEGALGEELHRRRVVVRRLLAVRGRRLRAGGRRDSSRCWCGSRAPPPHHFGTRKVMFGRFGRARRRLTSYHRRFRKAAYSPS